MEKLQAQIFKKTEELIQKVNYVFEGIKAAMTIAILIVFMVFARIPLNAISIPIIIVITLAYYAFMRSLTIKGNKQILYQLYKALKLKKKDDFLYIPMLEKFRQGYLVRSSAIYIYKDNMFLEAFQNKRQKTTQIDSVSISAGKDFYITDLERFETDDLVRFKGILMLKDYQFSIINNLDVIKIIENHNKKEVNYVNTPYQRRTRKNR